jgi:hypothetical protein
MSVSGCVCVSCVSMSGVNVSMSGVNVLMSGVSVLHRDGVDVSGVRVVCVHVVFGARICIFVHVSVSV